jgi:hypothetical protein
MEPGARFVADVLARTSRSPAPSAEWLARLAAAWRRLAHRPRIALEGAYAGAIILVLLFGSTNAPFADVPHKAIALVRTVQEALPAGTAEREVPRIRTAVRSRWTETRTEIQGKARDLMGDLKRLSSAAWDELKKDVGTIASRFASQNTTDDNEEAKGDR